MRRLIPLLALLVLIGCDGGPEPRRHVKLYPPCAAGELRAPNGECIPATLIRVPGVEGSGVTPSGPDNPTPPAPGLPRGFALTGANIHISARGLRLVASFEGFGSCPYWDPYGSVWTRGFGETEGIHRSSSCISRSYGERNLRARMERFYQPSVRALHVSLNQNQIDALDSFAWNLGPYIFRGSLRTYLQRGAFYAASRVMLGYVHAGGSVLSGLVRRRREEVALLLAGPPKPRPPTRAEQRRRLYAAYGRRRALRRALERHRCRVVHGRRAYRKCPRWGAEGRKVNRLIRDLQAKGIR